MENTKTIRNTSKIIFDSFNHKLFDSMSVATSLKGNN